MTTDSEPIRAADFTLSRRGALGAIAALTGGAALPTFGAARRTQEEARPYRIAHLTDIHLQPERNAERGFAACLAHVQSQPQPPDVIFTGGDNLMDVFDQAESRATLLADLWRRTLRNECSLPVEPCIGNHDIWAWNSQKTGVPEDAPLFGKAFALDLLGLAQRYRSFDRNGWHIIILDSIERHGNGYLAQLDEEQLAWLKADLEAKPAEVPCLVLSHAPVQSIALYTTNDRRRGNDLHGPTGLLHGDGFLLHQLFRRHNVKLCLSGHLHLLDRCEVNGVTYICDGAVCAGWWKGPHKTIPEGYGLVDLHPDGRFDHRYETFGWQAAP